MNFLENQDYIITTIGSIVFIMISLLMYTTLPIDMSKNFFPTTNLTFFIFAVLGIFLLVGAFLIKKILYHFHQ